MSTIGWELWGVKFDLLLIALLSLISFFTIWFSVGTGGRVGNVDQMAGDEGED